MITQQGAMDTQSKKDIYDQLQKEILLLQGIKPQSEGAATIKGLGPILSAFPNAVFPSAAIHEFIIDSREQAAASGGFIAGLLAALMQHSGIAMWISVSRQLFPSALKPFGLEPDRMIFADLKREKEVLWTMEEALKCDGLNAVIAEVQQISFKQSRRLQLAVEQSRVTGIILRNQTEKLSATASNARWKISPLPTVPEQGMPGLGFPRWQVELLKVRNGNPGSWQVEWAADEFYTLPIQKQVSALHAEQRKTEQRKTG